MDYSTPQRLRFAPSPTGSLHVGGARTALFNYLLARRTRGAFVLRIEDTDVERNRPETEAALLDDLRWLGLSWDEGPDAGGARGPYRQSERREVYRSHAARLHDAGAAYEDEGALRFRIPSGATVVDDLVKGKVTFENATLPDPVILKSGGGPTYNFAAALDDALMEISVVVRGDEHLPNTPVQQNLISALGLRAPRYAHVPLILNDAHQKLSKRHDTVGIEEFRARGIQPEAMIEHLALLGWSAPDGREEFSLDELAGLFSLERVHRGGAVFNEDRLRAFNARALRKLPREKMLALLEAAARRWGFEVERAWLETFLDAYGEELQTIEQARPHMAALLAEAAPVAPLEAERLHDPPVVALLEALDEYVAGHEDLHGLPLSRDIPALGERSGVAKKEAYHCVRLALSGQQQGPPLVLLFPLLGRERILRRLDALRRTGNPAGSP
ncbi:MAG: glutamate--tRNA ligase [Candidatus Eremiobacteraeota bacterium]|nr:glutamate--tRNA ligase [Candidatus Eremiobacteraeota bacterium]